MKNKFLIFKSLLFVSLFLISINLKAVDRNDSKPVEKLSAISMTEANKSTENTLVKKMTFSEKMKMIKAVKKEAKKAKKNTKGGTPLVILCILAVIIPPVAVGIFTNWGTPTLWNLLFTICFWIPGIIHAFYILFR